LIGKVTMKGSKNGASVAYATAATYFLAYLRERVQHEIDTFCRAVPLSAVELSAGLVELLSDAGERADHQVPVRVQARKRRPLAQALEGGQQPHGRGAQHSADKGNGKAAADPVKKRKKWVWTAARRKALTRTNQARWGKKTTPAQREAKRIANARYRAKKQREAKGLPVPKAA
jgi:hypothetical protein